MIPQSVKDVVGEWKGTLSDSDLGAALIGAGVLQAQQELVDEGTEPSVLSHSLEHAFELARESGAVLRWLPPVEALELLDAERCRDASRGRGVRLEIELKPQQATMAVDWHSSLLAGGNTDEGALGVYNRLIGEGNTRWRWPLPVGFLADDRSAAISGMLVGYTDWPVLELVQPPEDCDVLLLPHNVSELDSLDITDGIAPSLVVVLGSIDVDPRRVAEWADRWADRFGAAGCHFVDGAGVDSWMREFLREFSHNLTLDVALTTANARAAGKPGYTALTTSLASDTRLSLIVERFTRELYQAPATTIEIPDPVRHTLHGFPSAAAATPTEIAEWLEDHSHGFQFDAESREATGVAELMRSVGELPSFATANGGEHRGEVSDEIRVINGALYQDDRRLVTAMQVATEYRFEVWIGRPTTASDTSAGAAPLPTEDLPVGPKTLQVTFLAPRNRLTEQSQELILDDEGDTDHISFRVLVDEPGPIFGRVVVSYENRILQTATLRVMAVAGIPSRIGRPQIDVETVVRSHLADIPGGGKFDLALVVNQDDSGDRTASVISESGITLRSVDGLQESKDDLVALLTRVADSPEDYSEITSDACVELLFELATLGEAMHETFVEDHGIGPEFFKNGRLQLISAAPDSYLPVELFYAGPPPTDEPEPQLCDNFKDAALTGRCGTCEAAGAETRDPMPICPSWFWGIRYVIERHAHDPDFKEIVGDYRLQNEPTPQRNTISMLRSVVLAMSGNVLAADQATMRSELPGTSGRTGEATSWSDLKAQASALAPSLLMLLPHTEKLGVAFAMEIAGDKLLRANQIKKEYVSPSGEPTIAALLGCDTAHTEVPFQGLVPRFRRAGAGVVISTVNTILGRHAVPVAVKLLGLAGAIPKKETVGMGDLLRDLRRTTLSEGYPMVLSVVGFGDADWRISSEVSA